LQNSTDITSRLHRTHLLVAGTEATGLTDEWRKEATQNIIIPMQERSDE
jgi:TrmH family RNA methyltransferase